MKRRLDNLRLDDWSCVQTLESSDVDCVLRKGKEILSLLCSMYCICEHDLYGHKIFHWAHELTNEKDAHPSLFFSFCTRTRGVHRVIFTLNYFLDVNSSVS